MAPRALNEGGWARLREQLVERVRQCGVDDMEVLHAVAEVPRHRFVPEGVAHRSYEDAPLPIGYGQTISQPSLQALYLQLLELEPGDRVLEVGTGSGYQTALLARLASHVYSVERLRELSFRARTVLDELRFGNVALLVGDGSIGWPRYAPYEGIVVAAGAPKVPPALVEQLADGGRLLVPVGDRQEQVLLRIRRVGDTIEREEVAACAFVPLLGRFGWAEGRGVAGE